MTSAVSVLRSLRKPLSLNRSNLSGPTARAGNFGGVRSLPSTATLAIAANSAGHCLPYPIMPVSRGQDMGNFVQNGITKMMPIFWHSKNAGRQFDLETCGKCSPSPSGCPIVPNDANISHSIRVQRFVAGFEIGNHLRNDCLSFFVNAHNFLIGRVGQYLEREIPRIRQSSTMPENPSPFHCRNGYSFAESRA